MIAVILRLCRLLSAFLNAKALPRHCSHHAGQSQASVISRRHTVFPLFSENLPAHLKDCLKAFSASSCILPKLFKACLFNPGFHSLPSSTQSNDSSLLLEFGPLMARLGRCEVRFVYNGLPHRDKVIPSDVAGAHCDLLAHRIHKAPFIAVRRTLAPQDSSDESRCGLTTSDQSLGD